MKLRLGTCIAAFFALCLNLACNARYYYYKSDLSLILAAEGPAAFIHRAKLLGEDAFRVGLEDAVACAARNGLDPIKLMQDIYDNLEARMLRIKKFEKKSFEEQELALGILYATIGLSLCGLSYYFCKDLGGLCTDDKYIKNNLEKSASVLPFAAVAFIESMHKLRRAFLIHEDDHNLSQYESFLALTKDLQKKCAM